MRKIEETVGLATNIGTIDIEWLAIAVFGISAIIYVAIYLAKAWRRP